MDATTWAGACHKGGMDIKFKGTAAGITRRDFAVMLASGFTLPSLPFPHLAPSDTTTPPVGEVEGEWEAQGRIDAGRGIFHPPNIYVCWTYGVARNEADTEYQRGYWREFGRLRFERGEHDLL